MTAIRNSIKPTRRPGELGVHSVDRFHFAVPDLAVAKTFYGEFGLDLEEDGNLIAMKTRGNPHVWVTIGEGPRKKLGHLSFGAFEDDFDRFAERTATSSRSRSRRNHRPMRSPSSRSSLSARASAARRSVATSHESIPDASHTCSCSRAT